MADQEFMRKLLGPVKPEGIALDPAAKKKYEPLLISAMKHPDKDVRTACLYILDLLMVKDSALVKRVLEKTLQSKTRLGLLNLAKFVVHSEHSSEARLRPFRAKLAKRTEIHHEEFKRLLKGIPQNRVATAQSPSVGKMLIVIHGTWASGEDWWRPGSPFPNYLDSVTHSVYNGADPFSWSGRNSDRARIEGADILMKWTRAHPAQELTVVAHSHGGNVAILASRNGLMIDRLILLGTPSRLDYLPDLRHGIKLLYSVFSLGDKVQILGTDSVPRGEGRTLGDSQTGVSFRAMTASGSDLGHSDLHEVSVWQTNNFDRLLYF